MNTSYFRKMVHDNINLKLIPKFDSSESIMEWIEKVELVCNLCGVKKFEHLIPLWHERVVFTVYS